MKADSIKRCKEGLCLFFFLLLLSCFSNGAARNAGKEQARKDTNSFVREAKALVTAPAFKVPATPAAQLLTFPALTGTACSMRTQNEKILTTIRTSTKRYSLIKPPCVTAFYYHLFAVQDEDPLILG